MKEKAPVQTAQWLLEPKEPVRCLKALEPWLKNSRQPLFLEIKAGRLHCRLAVNLIDSKTLSFEASYPVYGDACLLPTAVDPLAFIRALKTQGGALTVLKAGKEALSFESGHNGGRIVTTSCPLVEPHDWAGGIGKIIVKARPLYSQSAAAWTKAARYVEKAVSDDEARIFMNGICLDLAENLMLATDGRRMAVASLNPLFNAGASPHDQQSSLIIPVQLFKGAALLFKPHETLHLLHYKEDKRQAVILDGPSSRVLCPLIEGQFPDWRRVLPKEEELGLRCVLAAADFIGAVKSLGSGIKKIWLEGKENRLQITAGNANWGGAKPKNAVVLQLPAQINGLITQTAFNPKYLLDAIPQAAQSVCFDFHKEGTANKTIKVSALEAGGLFSLVMPMQLD